MCLGLGIMEGETRGIVKENMPKTALNSLEEAPKERHYAVSDGYKNGMAIPEAVSGALEVAVACRCAMGVETWFCGVLVGSLAVGLVANLGRLCD